MKARPFGKLSRYAPSYPPTVYFVLLRRTRIQQATSLFPGRGGHVPSDLLSFLFSIFLYLMIKHSVSMPIYCNHHEADEGQDE